MKTLRSALLGVIVALAGVVGLASYGGAASGSPRLGAPVTSAVSFTKTADPVRADEAAGVRAQFALLTDHAVSPPAVVDTASIRSVGRSSFIAKRNDGSVCLSQRATLACYVGFERGGISTSIGDGRTYDSPEAPFQVVVDGIARDGVRSVTFELNDGTSATAPVTDNAFALTIAGHLANDLVGYTVATNAGTVSRVYADGQFPAPDAPFNPGRRLTRNVGASPGPRLHRYLGFELSPPLPEREWERRVMVSTTSSPRRCYFLCLPSTP